MGNTTTFAKEAPVNDPTLFAAALYDELALQTHLMALGCGDLADLQAAQEAVEELESHAA